MSSAKPSAPKSLGRLLAKIGITPSKPRQTKASTIPVDMRGAIISARPARIALFLRYCIAIAMLLHSSMKSLTAV
jgi:hypothetical protein